jgi:hypothetical protein
MHLSPNSFFFIIIIFFFFSASETRNCALSSRDQAIGEFSTCIYKFHIAFGIVVAMAFFASNLGYSSNLVAYLKDSLCGRRISEHFSSWIIFLPSISPKLKSQTL